jgi:ABC-type transport system involved in multi-copper enzyme maturation permease subunit
MLAKLAAIAKTTFLETIRQPIYGVLLWVAAGLLMINPSLAGFTLEGNEGDIKVVKDVGLATLLLYGLLASVFSAAGVITREIESHTVLTVISKPVNRAVFLAGKYLGVSGAVLLGYYFLCLVFLLSIRHGTMATAADRYDVPVLLFSGLAILLSLIAATFGNYVYGWHFSTALTTWVVPLGTLAFVLVLFISKEWTLQSPATDFGNMQLAYAVTMTFCGVLILTAFAVALATRFSQVITLLLCAAVYVLGLLSDYYLGRPAEAGGAWLYSVLYAAVPNFQFFWTGDALTQQQIIPAAQVGQVAAYSVTYSLAVLALGVTIFETREVG